METITVTKMDWHEFDKLIVDNLLGGKGEFNCVACEEWNNDESHLFQVSKKDADSSYYNKYSLPDIEDFIANKPGLFRIGVHSLFTYLCSKDIIPEGNYLIEVSW